MNNLSLKKIIVVHYNFSILLENNRKIAFKEAFRHILVLLNYPKVPNN